MPQSVTDAVKVWSAPALLSVVLALCAMLWVQQEARVKSLEDQVSSSGLTIAGISSSQQQSKEDRQDFQTATTARLNQVADSLTALNNAVVRLTTLQEERAK